MPPKAPRGRGRGKGRGGASQSSRPATEEETDAGTQDVSMSDVGATTQAAEPTEAAPNDAAPISVASTPQPSAPITLGDTPTGTPAPPGTPGVQRSDSQTRRTATPGSATPGSAATRGAKKNLLAKPRAGIRRSKEDRAALDAAHNARRAEEAKRTKPPRKFERGGRGRGRGGGRGGFMGERERDAPIASGPFSAGTVQADVSRRRPGGGVFTSVGASGAFGGGRGGGGRSGGPSRIKSEGGDDGVTYVGDYESDSSVEEVQGPRKKDIDYINLISDDEGGPAHGQAPIRVQRVEHRDRNQPITTEKSKQDANKMLDDLEKKSAAAKAGTTSRTPSPTATRKGKQRAKEPETATEEHKWKGVYSDSEGEHEAAVSVKPDPDAMEVDRAQQDESQPAPKAPTSPEKRKSRPKRTVVPETQTQEDREEWERHMFGLETLRDELGEITTPQPPPAPATDASGDTNMAEDTATDVNDKRADRVYLFQFPPVLPDLKLAEPGSAPTDTTTTDEPADGPSAEKVKAEPKSPELSRSIPAAPAPGAANNTADKPIKIEDSAAPSLGPGPHLASGRVGKLRIHASGRATMDWGGTSLQLNMGVDAQFLQDVVVVRQYQQDIKEDEEDRERAAALAAEEIGGEVLAFGQVKGKFVVTPDWAEIV
ncbi:hypothetical protein MBLNU457_5924t1 [Dothideomycetes sp. NU457]